MNKNKVRILLYLVTLLTVFPFFTPAFGIDGNDSFEQPISLHFTQKELGEVLKQISDMTGVQIIYDKELASQIVSGAYKDVPLSTAVSRLMRGTNNSMQFDAEHQTLLIEGFGKTQYVTTSGKGKSDFYMDTGLTYEEIEETYALQLKEFEQRTSDDNEFIPELGVTRGEMETMYEEQISQFEKDKNNANMIIPETGLTHGEMAAEYDKQIEAFENSPTASEEVVPEAGMTRSEIETQYRNQLASFEANVSNGDLYIEEVGMSAQDYKEVYNEQLAAFENK